MNPLLEKLNPCRILSVQEAKEIARIVTADYKFQPIPLYEIESVALKLLQAQESLLNERLVEGMFVNSVEKPRWSLDMPLGSDKYNKAFAEWKSADRQILFKGFEKSTVSTCGYKSKEVDKAGFPLLLVYFKYLGVDDMVLHLGGQRFRNVDNLFPSITLRDLFTEIERYNRTATEKINLEPTENYLERLKIKP